MNQHFTILSHLPKIPLSCRQALRRLQARRCMPVPHHNSALRTLSQSHKPTHLLHLHLPGLTLYTTASAIQERIVQRHFAAKDQLRRTQDGSASAPDPPAIPPPPPLIITFSTPPTYTVGRRYLTTNPLPASQIAFLQGLDASSPSTEPLAAFNPSPRGGDLTYHGPGQLTAYAIIDLRTHSLTPRCYVRLLEETVMRTCAHLGVSNTTTTTDPGVWISEEPPSPSSPSSLASSTPSSTPTPIDRKICALGVQIRRGITAHGIGLNVHDHPAPPEYQSQSQSHQQQASASDPPGYLTWGFSRILACGLPGKTVTWLSREAASPPPPNDDDGKINTHPTNPQTRHDLDQNTTTTNPRLRAHPSLTTTSPPVPFMSTKTHTAARVFAVELADALALGLNTTNPRPTILSTPPSTSASDSDPQDNWNETSINLRNREQSGSESKDTSPVVRRITLQDIVAW